MSAHVEADAAETHRNPLGPAPALLYCALFLTVGRLAALAWRIKWLHSERVPATGPVIIAANHRSFLDPFAVGLGLSWRRPIHYMAKIEMFVKQPLRGFLTLMNAFPVNRDAADRGAIKEAIAVLSRNSILGMFPEGTRVHEGQTASPQMGTAFIAMRTRAKIVPVGLAGTEKIMRPGKRLPTFPPVTISYGPQIDPAGFDDLPRGERLAALTQAIMNGIDESFRDASEFARSR